MTLRLQPGVRRGMCNAARRERHCRRLGFRTPTAVLAPKPCQSSRATLLLFNRHPRMHAVTIAALPTASANTYANQTCIRPARSPSRGFSRKTLRADKRRGFPGDQSCGCKRQKVVTHVQQGSGASTKVLKETAALDQLIDLFLGARSQQQLAKLVADNILSLDQKFWLRLATRSDTATTKEDKQKIGSLASTVMTMANAVVKQTEGQLSQSASSLQSILTAAADENGEWHLPLTAQQTASMRQALDQHLGSSAEALLSTAFSYMRKAADDKQDGMISLLQKMLQLYAAKALCQDSGPKSPIDEVISADEEQWELVIRQLLQSDAITENAFLEDLQKRMESTVLGQSSGSYTQRVQAEYLKEIEARFKEVCQSHDMQ